MKKLMTLAALALSMALTSACALGETVLQLGTTVNEQDSFHVAATKFAELVSERTNTRLRFIPTARSATKARCSTR